MFSMLMRSARFVALLTFVLFIAPCLTSTAAGFGLEDAKVALHLQAHTTKSPCSIVSAPTIPCYQYQTAGDVGVGYDLYLVVGSIPVGDDGPYDMSALSCGIEYDGAAGQGVDVYSWTYCGDGLEFPKDGPLGPWPNAGAGIRLTWLTCYAQEIPPSGGHKIAGSFYVYAYGADRFSVTENRNLESGPEFKLAGCNGSEVDLPLSAAGAAAFSLGITDPGFNPCPQEFPAICNVPVRNLSFGPVGIGGYTDLAVHFSNDGAPENGAVEGTVTETCPDVTIVSGESYSLEPGEQANVVLRFTPSSVGPSSCNVNLGSTCSSVQLAGSGVVSPHPEVDPQAIVREVWTETSRSQSFQVSNLGGASLFWDTKLEFGTLEDVLAALDAHSGVIVASIPNRYNFSGGVTGNSLGPPPFSSLSNGNCLTTDIGIAFGEDLDYSDGVIRPSTLLGPGGRYFTRKYPGLFVFVGDFVGVQQFKIQGSVSPDYLNKDYFWIRELSLPGYMALLHRNWGGYSSSPSLHQVFITLDLPNVAFSYNSRFNANEPSMNQLKQVTRFYYFLYMGANNADIPVSAATQTINTFLESFHPAQPWMTTAAAGEVAPQGSGTGEIAFSAVGLAPGEYHGQASIRSNSVHRPVVVVPVTMQVTEPSSVEVAGIEIDPNTLNPGSNGPWVNAYIELPSGDDPSEVVLETVRAQGVVPADPSAVEIGDNDADGVPDLRFRFDRRAFLQTLPPQDEVEAWVSGEIRDQHYVVGRQSIRVLRPHLQKPNGGERLQAGTFVEILWNLDEVGNADALTASYSLNGGSTWTSVGTVPPSQPLVWQVPAEVTDQGLLRVEASREGVFLGYDESDLPFSVVASTTGIGPGPGVPVTALFQNAPNPFTTRTRIAYSLADPGEVRLEVFNLSGMRVRTLIEGPVSEGAHEASWDGRDDASRRMPSGIYIVRLRTASADMSRRLLLVL